MNIFIFEPRVNLVIAWLCFCAACVLTGCAVSWMTKYICSKIARRRRLKRLKEVHYV